MEDRGRGLSNGLLAGEPGAPLYVLLQLSCPRRQAEKLMQPKQCLSWPCYTKTALAQLTCSRLSLQHTLGVTLPFPSLTRQTGNDLAFKLS
eukprot:1156926-Pelagomonas_calceolata.AAC.4